MTQATNPSTETSSHFDLGDGQFVVMSKADFLKALSSMSISYLMKESIVMKQLDLSTQDKLEYMGILGSVDEFLDDEFEAHERRCHANSHHKQHPNQLHSARMDEL